MTLHNLIRGHILGLKDIISLKDMANLKNIFNLIVLDILIQVLKANIVMAANLDTLVVNLDTLVANLVAVT